MKSKLLRNFSLSLLLMMLVSTIGFAQDRKVTGKVTETDGSPIPGVNVALRGQPSNVSTNADGVYTIQVKSDADVLVFSYIGFTRQQVTVGNRSKINVTMAADQQVLQEVTINVGYSTKKKNESLGSTAVVSGEELQDIPAPNLAGALRNRVAGVGVGQVSGRPGAPITLNIRNSTASETAANQVGATAEPLYVVDGIVVTRDAFDNIDASMVENLTFLKDASAAIYGASGAKGVVLVTTKRGKIGKPSITYNGYLGLSDAASTPKMLSGYDHAKLLNDTYTLQRANLSDYFSDTDLEYIKNLDYKSWYDEVWQPATTQRHNIGISGGTEKITFFAGGSYQGENGNYAGMQFNKYSFRSGLVANLAKGLKADVNFNVDYGTRELHHNANDQDNTFFERIITIPRWVPISIDGNYVNFGTGTTNINPMAVAESGYYSKTNNKGYRINTSLTYEPTFLKGFTARLQISQASGSANSTQYVPPYRIFNYARFGNNNQLFTNQLVNTSPTSFFVEPTSAASASITPGVSDNNSYQGFLTLQYGRTFGKHTANLLVGGEQSEGNSQASAVRYVNQLIPGIDQYWAFDAATLARQDFSRTQTSKRSGFGRFSYDFDKKYLFEVIARVDASSQFATGQRWGVSPNAGLGWIVSQENFFKNSKALSFINFLKVKANVGITGDDRVGARLWQDRFLIDVTNGYLYGNSVQNSLNRARLANPDITWEKKRTINIGLETSMFNNKLDFSVEVFQNRSYNQFDLGGNNSFPLYFGTAAPIINYRETYNWGSEFSIGYKANLTSDLKLNANMNFGFGNSIVTQTLYAPGNLFNNVASDWLTGFGTDPRVYNSSNIGLKNIGMFRTQADVDAWMAKYPNYRLYDQVPQAGWLYFEDTNGDGVVSDSDMKPLFKNTNAFLATGITLNLAYKNWALNTNINARFGGKVFYDSRSRSAPSVTRNVLDIWQDRWTPENPTEGRYPRFDDPSLTRNSDFWAVDGTTIRINTMTLSYKAPAAFANRLGLGGARILLTGNNLWTLVNPLPYKDPYTSSAWDYPILRTISLGLSVNL